MHLLFCSTRGLFDNFTVQGFLQSAQLFSAVSKNVKLNLLSFLNGFRCLFEKKSLFSS